VVCGNPGNILSQTFPSGEASVKACIAQYAQSSSRKRHVVKILLDLYAPSARFLYEAKPALSAFSIYSAVSMTICT
jgi:hypothetical protein